MARIDAPPRGRWQPADRAGRRWRASAAIVLHGVLRGGVTVELRHLRVDVRRDADRASLLRLVEAVVPPPAVARAAPPPPAAPPRHRADPQPPPLATVPRAPQPTVPPVEAITAQAAPVAAAPASAAPVAAAPASAASAPPRTALLDTPESRAAIRALARQPLLSERAASATGIPLPIGKEQKLANGVDAAKYGDCSKGEYALGGMGLLSLPFYVAAELSGKCAK